MSQAATDVQQMQQQIAQYGSVTQFGIRVQNIQGNAGEQGNTGYFNSNTGGSATGSNGQTYDAGWELGNWGDTLTFVPR